MMLAVVLNGGTRKRRTAAASPLSKHTHSPAKLQRRTRPRTTHAECPQAVSKSLALGGLNHVDRPTFRWLGNCIAQSIAELCERNDSISLKHFLQSANHAHVGEDGPYPVRTLGRMVVRMVAERRFAVVELLIDHLSRLHCHCAAGVCQRGNSAMQELCAKLCKLLFTAPWFGDRAIATRCDGWIARLIVDGCTCAVCCPLSVFRGFVSRPCIAQWRSLRDSTRALIVHRLFAINKADLHETYLPHFAADAFEGPQGVWSLAALARECRIVVSKSQLYRSLFSANYVRCNGISDDLLTAILRSWRGLSRPELVSQCRITSDDLQRLLLIPDAELRRQRLDTVTSAGPTVFVHAEELQRFHITGFDEATNPLPWIHATIVIPEVSSPTAFTARSDRSDERAGASAKLLRAHITAFYLSTQAAVRDKARTALRATLARVLTGLPPELVNIIVPYLLQRVQDLVRHSICPPSSHQRNVI